MKSFLIILQLYIPAVVLIMFLVNIFRIKKTSDSLKIKVPLGPFLSYERPVKNIITIKVIYCIIILLSAIWYIWVIDFTNLFPNKLKVTVSFDDYGIRKLYNEIGIKEVNGLVIDINDTTLKRKYIHERDSILSKYNKISNCLEATLYGDLSKLTCTGETDFIVNKKSGFHNYLIEHSKGELNFSFIPPHKRVRTFKVAFELLPNPRDKIDFSITEHLFKNKIVLTPSFQETLIVEEDTGTKLRNDHELFGVTQLTFFLMPKLSNTLYLYKVNNKLIPICYAVNIED